MNKYKIALSDIMCFVPFGELEEQEKILQELVEKATPKKVKNITDYYSVEIDEYEYTLGYCPYCNKDIIFDKYYQLNYCSECGQKLDWSEDDE